MGVPHALWRFHLPLDQLGLLSRESAGGTFFYGRFEMTFVVKRSNPLMHMADEFFSSRIATKYGLLEAVVISNISRLIADSPLDEKIKDLDGAVYVKCSARALAEYMPYASEHQLRRAIDRLHSTGAIKKKQLAKSEMDRTSWLTIGEISCE